MTISATATCDNRAAHGDDPPSRTSVRGPGNSDIARSDSNKWGSFFDGADNHFELCPDCCLTLRRLITGEEWSAVRRELP